MRPLDLFVYTVMVLTNLFIHKSAFFNGQRTPQINDIVTLSINKDESGQICASDSIFLDEKWKNVEAKKYE
jgi:hypothetical protein